MILLLGDFNLHVDIVSDSNSLEFLRLLDSLDYILHVKGHTLDLLISHGLAVKNIITLDLTISDHLAILF